MGFGRELAIAAANNKDKVIATSRKPENLADLEKQFGIVPQKLDIKGSDEYVKSVIDEVQSTVGPIDILVNNAGHMIEGAIEEARHVPKGYLHVHYMSNGC